MTAKSTIVSEISSKARASGYSNWRIGLTHDVIARRKYWRDTRGHNVSSWANWTADSLSDAQEIEAYFIHEKMMEGGTGGDLSANKTVFVYIY